MSPTPAPVPLTEPDTPALAAPSRRSDPRHAASEAAQRRLDATDPDGHVRRRLGPCAAPGSTREPARTPRVRRLEPQEDA